MLLRRPAPILRVSLLVSALVSAGVSGDPGAGDRADLVLRGAVYTLDPSRPWAEAVAVRGERIVYVGDSQGAGAFIGPGTRVLDLAGKMVLPGFHDAHVHPVGAGVELGLCNLNEAADQAEVLAMVAKYASAHPEREWITGGGFQLPIFPGGVATREDLDAVTGDRPAFLSSADGHSAWVNSRALALAGVTAGTSDPPNGRIERNAAGEPVGTLRESAMSLVGRLVPPVTAAERAAGLDRALGLAARFGITSWIEASSSREVAETFLAASRDGRLTVRTGLSFALEQDGESVPLDSLQVFRDRYRGPHLRGDAVKIFVDGVIEGRTAALLEPYRTADGGGGQDRGELNYSPRELERRVVDLDREGFQIHAHAIGDRAIRVTLDALARAAIANGPRDRRAHLAHIQLFAPADIPRFREQGVIANFQPFWCYADAYMTDLTEPALGPERSRWQYPIRSMLASGATVAAGSDWSVSSLNPLDAIEVAITHQPPGDAEAAIWNPEERVTLPDILAAYTTAGAYVMRQESETGSLAVGKAADLIVLDRNLFEIEPHAIHKVRVLLTLLGGQPVWQDESWESR